MTSQCDITVVIPGMNTHDYVKQCLTSLYETEWQGYTFEVIYIDNGSKDDSVAMVRREFPQVRLYANETNVGFCKAANQGTREANGRFVLHLNNDTLLYSDSIPRLARYLDENPRVDIAGSRLLNHDLTEQWSARRFPTWLNGMLGRRSLLSRMFPDLKPVRDYLYKDELQGAEPFLVDWVPTPSMMVRTSRFLELGGFPEDFYYWHEAIFCMRLKKAGGKVGVVPLSKVVHFEGKGGGPRPYKVRRWHIVDFHKGAYRFYREKHDAGALDPRLWFAAVALRTREALLLTANWLTSLRETS